MMAAILLVVLLAAVYALGWVVGRRTLDDRDPGWLPPERRRWRP